MKRYRNALVLLFSILLFPAQAGGMTLEEFRKAMATEFHQRPSIIEEAFKSAAGDPVFLEEVYYVTCDIYAGTNRSGLARELAKEALSVLPKNLHARIYAVLCEIAVKERKPEEAKQFLLLSAEHVEDDELKAKLRGYAKNVEYCAMAINHYSLRQAFIDDRKQAEERFYDKEVILYLHVRKIYERYAGVFVGANGYGDGDENPDIACWFEGNPGIKAYSTILMKGRYVGMHRDLLVFTDCAVIEIPQLFNFETAPEFPRSGKPTILYEAYDVTRGLP